MFLYYDQTVNRGRPIVLSKQLVTMDNLLHRRRFLCFPCRKVFKLFLIKAILSHNNNNNINNRQIEKVTQC